MATHSHLREVSCYVTRRNSALPGAWNIPDPHSAADHKYFNNRRYIGFSRGRFVYSFLAADISVSKGSILLTELFFWSSIRTFY
jgi:hypothetical protein